jgi:hypothetical protein
LVKQMRRILGASHCVLLRAIPGYHVFICSAVGVGYFFFNCSLHPTPPLRESWWHPNATVAENWTVSQPSGTHTHLV